MTNLQNKQAAANSKRLNDEIAAIKAKKARETFVERNYGIKTFLLYILYPITTLYSIFTEGSFLYSHFSESFTSSYLAMFVTALLVIAIESGKFWFGKEFFDDAFDGQYQLGRYYLASFFIKLVGFILFLGGSAYLSIKGSPTVASFYIEKSRPLELVDIAAIDTDYDGRIAAIAQTEEAGKAMTWKGKVVSDGRDLLKSAQEQKNLLEQQRIAAKDDARLENDRRRTDYQTREEKSGGWFTNFAGIGEIITFCILLFLGNYEKGVAEEIEELHSPAPNKAGIGFQNQRSNPVLNNESTRRPIGFQIPQREEKQPDIQAESKPETPQDSAAQIQPESREAQDIQAESRIEIQQVEITKIQDFELLKKRCRNYWRRAHEDGKTDEYRKTQLFNYKEAREELEKNGYEVNERTDRNLTIELRA